MALDIETLLADRSPDEPCGPDLQYDPEYYALLEAAKGKPPREELAGQVVDGEEPNWNEVKASCLGLLGRTLDLQLVMFMLAAAGATEGLPGLRDGLSLLKRSLEQHWDHVHPQLDPDDDNDPLERINLVSGLAVVPGSEWAPAIPQKILREAPLATSRQLGNFSFRDVLFATGEAQPPAGVTAPDMALIEGAFSDTDPDELAKLGAAAAALVTLSKGIDDWLTAKVGANHAPVVVVKSPPKSKLPKHSAQEYGGDLTTWFKAFCETFALEPANDPDLDQAQLKDECDKALRLLCQAGMVWRYGPALLKHEHEVVEGTEEMPGGLDDAQQLGWLRWARLNRELKILADKLISAYFLIVWDFTNWGRQRGIPALARGSGVGTMVGYVLGLSNACPVDYGLLFERFTDPDRTEYPDIDIDLCQDGRGEVIEYVREKYGHVAQIITFGTLKARAAVRDVGRVLEYPLPDTDKLAKLIPEELGITLDKALKQEPDLKKVYDNDDVARRVIENAKVMEGQARHSSVHAAGVIVATRPLHEVVPLYRQAGSADHELVTQWDGPTCEKMGLLKMDFLGLRTLSIIERAKKLIVDTLDEDAIWAAVGRGGLDEPEAQARDKQNTQSLARASGSSKTKTRREGPHPLDLDRLEYTDQRVFGMFQRGDSTGVFQFESGGMRRLLIEMKPDRLEDLIAANALFRPGPMDLIPDYNKRKHGAAEVPTVHPIVDKFTAETYGVMVYQEQVMQIVHELGGIPLRQAYALIKAISKKKQKVIAENRPKFVECAEKQGLDASKAEELFELILKFACYGFNKSHSTGYAIVAYQTAYLKTYFPSHYMAAFLTFESQAQKVSDWIPYLEDCKRCKFIEPSTGEVIKTGVEVRPPNVNLSQADFSVVYEKKDDKLASAGHVRFGLKALKGAGGKAIEAIITEREKGGAFKSLHDFCERVPSGSVNKATIEALVKSGAFDDVHSRDDRASLVATIDSAVSAGQKLAADRAAGQGALFGAPEDDGRDARPTEDSAPLVRVDPWSESETRKQEKETLGFYVSSHPLEQWKDWSGVFAKVRVGELAEVPQDQRVIVAALIQSVRPSVVRNGRSAGQKIGIVTIEDLSGSADAVMFADCYAKYMHLFEDDGPKFVLGRMDHSRGGPQIIVDRMVPIDGVPLEKGRLHLRGDAKRLIGSSETVVGALRQMLGERAKTNGTSVPVLLDIETESALVTVQPEPVLRVDLEPELITEVSGVLGAGCVSLVGGKAIDIEEKKPRYRKGG